MKDGIIIKAMICFDYFLLMKFHFFQYYYPETASVYPLKKYGFNIKSQLLKLLAIFPAISALAAWICTLLQESVRIGDPHLTTTKRKLQRILKEVQEAGIWTEKKRREP